jgi:uncharacterized SAM-binding protein YcdF (DUF218 family)
MMFVIKKVLGAFLVPPGIFVSLLVLSGILAIRRQKFRAGGLCWLLAFVIWLSSIVPTAHGLLRGLESSFQLPKTFQGDVIIVLGAGTLQGVADLSGKGFPDGDTLARLVTAIRIQQRLKVPLLISSGQVYPDEVAGAAVARRILLDLGIPEDQIITEEKSRDTAENAVYSKAICDQRGFTHPLLVTSALHLSRALLAFKRAGLDVTPVPADFKTIAHPSYGWHDYLPSADAMRGAASALHEYLGLWFFQIAG